MTAEAKHARFYRTHARAWLCAVALGCFWLNAGAVNKGNIGRASITSNGKSTTVGPVTNTSGSTIPVSPNVGGWTQAGNYGVPPAATGATVAIVTPNGQTVVGGSAQRYPFAASYTIPWGTIATGAAGVICVISTAGACGVASAAAFAAPYIMDWMSRAGAKRNEATGEIETQPVDSSWPVSDGYRYSTVWQPPGTSTPQYFDSPIGACQGMAPAWGAANGINLTNIRVSGTACIGNTGGNPNYPFTQASRGPASSCPAAWYITPFGCFSSANLPRVAVTATQLADLLSKVVPDSRVWGEVLEKGAEIPFPTPTVTGPAVIQGPEKTTTNPDGSRTVERTTYNYQTSGNTINNTSNVTTTTTYNADNSVRSTSSTTTTPTAEETDKNDQCEKRPNSVGCAEADTPDGVIPKETKTITYAEENVFGGGSCPSDKQWSSGTLHHSYKLVDWTTFCGYALSARALVILLAVFAAFLIVMPGKEVRT